MLIDISSVGVVLASCIVCVLYAWFGLCFASSMIMALFLLGYHDVKYVVAPVLLTQLCSAMISSVVKRSIVHRPRTSLKGGAIIGLAALASFMTAYTVGVKLPNEYRLATNGMLLLLAALTNLVCREGTRIDADPLGSMIVGIVGGGIKGALGGGTTGIMIAIQRLRGVAFDDALFRTVVSHVFICMAAALPYILAYGIDISLLAMMLVGSMIGTVFGAMLQRYTNAVNRRRASSAIMALFSALLFFESVESALGA